MTPKQTVRKIYKGAWCAKFRDNPNFPDEKFIIRYRQRVYCRPEAIGWGKTPQKAWYDAAHIIGIEMLRKLGHD